MITKKILLITLGTILIFVLGCADRKEAYLQINYADAEREIKELDFKLSVNNVLIYSDTLFSNINVVPNQLTIKKHIVDINYLVIYVSDTVFFDTTLTKPINHYIYFYHDSLSRELKLLFNIKD